MLPHVCLAFGCGLFVVAVQVLLLGECMTALGGGDLWIGAFLGAWFLSGAAGGLAFRRFLPLLRRLDPAPETFSLAYIPILFLQCLGFVLLVAMGPEPGSVPPFQDVLAWSLLIAAPGGLLTGLLFPVLCRRTGEREHSFLTVICAYGAAGGVLEGLIASLLPCIGMSTVRVLLILAVVLCGCAACSAWTRPPQKSRRTRVATAVCLGVALAAVILRADVPLARGVQKMRWSRLVPTGTLDGSFRTTQG